MDLIVTVSKCESRERMRQRTLKRSGGRVDPGPPNVEPGDQPPGELELDLELADHSVGFSGVEWGQRVRLELVADPDTGELRFGPP